jgi:hypothetical protein
MKFDKKKIRERSESICLENDNIYSLFISKQ